MSAMSSMRSARDLAHPRDELERRARVVAHARARARGTRRRRRRATAPAGRRRRCARRRATTRTRARPSASDSCEQLHHGRDLVVVGGAARRRPSPITTRRMRRVTDEEAGVDADAAVEAVEPLAEESPVPVAALLERRRAACPRRTAIIRMHVVDVLGAERRDREAAVAADDGGDAVERRRRHGGSQSSLGVVVGVDVDEPGRDDEAVGVDRASRPASSIVRRPRRCGHRARRRRRAARARRCRRRRRRRGSARSSMPVPHSSAPRGEQPSTAASTTVPAKNAGLPPV